MIISDLNYLEAVSEAASVVGGTGNKNKKNKKNNNNNNNNNNNKNVEINFQAVQDASSNVVINVKKSDDTNIYVNSQGGENNIDFKVAA